MSSSLTFAAMQNRVQIYHLDEGDTVLRSDRLSPLNKPRSVTRQSSVDTGVDTDLCENTFGMREFNMQQDDVFTIEELAPLELKKFENLEAVPFAFETDHDVLGWICAVLSESPLGHALLQEVQETSWRLALGDLGTGGFHLDAMEKIVELDCFGLDVGALGQSAFFRYSLICVLAKALRDIWHENRWGAFEADYKAEAVLLLERARAADADSVAVLIGRELRSAGYDDIWRHMIGAEEGDMAQVLMNILDRYPTALYNGMAMAHLFRQWYADTARVDAMDHATLEQIDSGLLEGFLSLGNKDAIAQDFEILSTLPDGSTYLKDLGDTVARDPYFNGLNDPINQAHLFQIVYDSKVTYVDGIPFRDPKLARKFFRAD